MPLPPSMCTHARRLAAAALAAASMWLPSSANAQTCGSLTNSGFESDLTGWTNTGNTSIVSDAHSGARAARIGPGQGGLNRSGTFPVTAGQPLTFQVWAKIAAGPSWAGVGLDFLDGSGGEISERAIRDRRRAGLAGRVRDHPHLGHGQRRGCRDVHDAGEPQPARSLDRDVAGGGAPLATP
jgi:hypothetical protein